MILKGSQILKKLRKYAAFFEWHYKKRKEKGVLESLCESMEKVEEAPYRSINKPRQIGTAFFLFSYNSDPSLQRCPYVRLSFSDSK